MRPGSCGFLCRHRAVAVAQLCATELPGQVGPGFTLPPLFLPPVSEAQVPASLRRAGPQVRIPGHWAGAVVFLNCRLFKD